MDRLVIRGARQHNLKNVSLDLPRHAFVVLTGPSGSGKSSLAFDTIYAEGQRRYVESLSAYARQYLEQLGRPDVDGIEGLSPAIAIEQRPLPKNPRSTVGTVTEIADYLRLLFARIGIPHCPRCGKRIEAQTVPQIVDRILALGEDTRVTLLAPIVRGRRSELKLELAELRRQGFVRARIDGVLVELSDEIVLDRARPHDLDLVIDRFPVKANQRSRVHDSVELALERGEGRLLVVTPDTDEPLVLSERFACVDCGVSLPPIEPRMFSFNSPHGACPACSGIGVESLVDPERVVPNPARSLREGAIAAWGRRGSVSLAVETDRAVRALGVPADVPWRDLPKEQRDALLFGPGDDAPPSSRAPGRPRKKGAYEGIVPRLQRRLAGDAPPSDDDEDGEAALDELSRFFVERVCGSCGGKRLRPDALAIKLGGLSIADVGGLALAPLRAFCEALPQTYGRTWTSREARVGEPLLSAVRARLGFLVEVGLDYLTLDRSVQSLSGGEAQRIRLATQIGAALSGVLYVLDEPSVGLHARDNARLLEAVRRLVTLGNGVLVVEHDREAILAADHVVDMGPGAGEHGGTIVAQGTPREIAADPASVTGPYLRGTPMDMPARLRSLGADRLRIRGARAHNLKGVDVELPVGALVAVTGVSGSGRSSLVLDTLVPFMRAKLAGEAPPEGRCDGIDGLELFDKLIDIDQAPLGRTPRSNAATYTGVFALLRELYAGLPAARTRGYKPGRFSFNVKGGRCEACHGDGVHRIEMVFLPDVFVTCEECGGKRYDRETLEVLFRGYSIADVLGLDVETALGAFEAVPKIRERLAALSAVGLGYLRLGQPATTLSGGEAQRVKLARELARRATGRTLYVLDEPTTGLHFRDIEVLMRGLSLLREQGNTVVLIEHNLDVVAASDWVVDLGPEGGDAGGHLVVAGPPELVAEHPTSHTGRHLRATLGGGAPAPKAAPKRSKGKKK